MTHINCQLTFLIDREQTTIELYDADAGITFFRGTLTDRQAIDALSRLGNVPMAKAVVHSLDYVGKVQEYQSFEFELPKDLRFLPHGEGDGIAGEAAQRLCPAGWQPDMYFRSQSSFFIRDGKPMARTMIRRWVEREPVQGEGEKRDEE